MKKKENYYLDKSTGQLVKKDIVKCELLQNIPNHGLILGKSSFGKKIRTFKLKDFDEDLAQGYIKLILSEDKKILVKVIDTYGHETKEEQEQLIKKGYIKVGYKE